MGRGSYKIDQPRSWAEIAIPKKKYQNTKIPKYKKKTLNTKKKCYIWTDQPTDGQSRL